MSNAVLNKNIGTVDKALFVWNFLTTLLLYLILQGIGFVSNYYHSYVDESTLIFLQLIFIPLIVPFTLLVVNINYNLKKRRRSFLQNLIMMFLLPIAPIWLYFLYIHLFRDPSNSIVVLIFLIWTLSVPLLIVGVVGQIILWIKLRKST